MGNVLEKDNGIESVESPSSGVATKCFTCGENGEMSAEETLLHHNNWEHWYGPKGYWVRPDTVSDPTRQDFTNYQLTTEQALEFQKNPKPAPYCGDIGAALKTYVEMKRKVNESVVQDAN